jgi:nitrate/nitrite transport system substrate-binding protein
MPSMRVRIVPGSSRSLTRQVVRGAAAPLATAIVCALGIVACGGSSGERSGSAAPAGTGASGGLERPQLKLGFIKLTDMAPLVIAREMGF